MAIPDNVTTAALLPAAYFTSQTFKPANRKAAAEVTYWESWGEKQGSE